MDIYNNIIKEKEKYNSLNIYVKYMESDKACIKIIEDMSIINIVKIKFKKIYSFIKILLLLCIIYILYLKF